MIYIDQETGKRVNPYAPYKGFSRLETPEQFLKAGVISIEDDPIPEDAIKNPDFYTIKEDWETNQRPYTVYTRKSDEQIAEIRWQKIKAHRDELKANGGCFVSDKWFHTDTDSKLQQMALKDVGDNLPSDLMWKTMDGTFIHMTSTLAMQIFQAQMLREQAIFAHAEKLKLDPDADISIGWPARYGEVQ